MAIESSAAYEARRRKQEAAKVKPIKNQLTKWKSRSRLPSRSKSRSNPHRTQSGSISPSQQSQRPHSLPTVSDSRPTPLSQQNQCPHSLLPVHNTEKPNCLPIPPKCKSNENDLKSFTDKLKDIQLREAAALAELERLEKEAAAREKKRLEEEAAALEKKRLEEEAAALEKKRLEEEAAALEKKRLEEEAAALDEDKENAVLGKIAKKPPRENEALVLHMDGKILTVKNPPPPPCTNEEFGLQILSDEVEKVLNECYDTGSVIVDFSEFSQPDFSGPVKTEAHTRDLVTLMENVIKGSNKFDPFHHIVGVDVIFQGEMPPTEYLHYQASSLRARPNKLPSIGEPIVNGTLLFSPRAVSPEKIRGPVFAKLAGCQPTWIPGLSAHPDIKKARLSHVHIITAAPDSQRSAGGAGPGLAAYQQPTIPFKVPTTLQRIRWGRAEGVVVGGFFMSGWADSPRALRKQAL
eukprot:scaffold3932_cov87-Cyclotella_meneghiniana.AAC.30